MKPAYIKAKVSKCLILPQLSFSPDKDTFYNRRQIYILSSKPFEV